MNKLLEYLNHNDWKLKLPPVERKIYDTMTGEEREQYINVLNKNFEGIPKKNISELKAKEIKYIMDRAIVMIQTMLVSRPREVCDIEIRNIDFERHKITLRDSKAHEIIIRMGMKDALGISIHKIDNKTHQVRVKPQWLTYTEPTDVKRLYGLGFLVGLKFLFIKPK